MAELEVFRQKAKHTTHRFPNLVRRLPRAVFIDIANKDFTAFVRKASGDRTAEA